MLTVSYGSFCFGWAPIYHILTGEIPSSRESLMFVYYDDCCI